MSRSLIAKVLTIGIATIVLSMLTSCSPSNFTEGEARDHLTSSGYTINSFYRGTAEEGYYYYVRIGKSCNGVAVVHKNSIDVFFTKLGGDPADTYTESSVGDGSVSDIVSQPYFADCA